MLRWMSPLLASVVNSKRLMSEIAMPSPFSRARSMAFRAFRESRLGSNASQTTHVRIDENHLRLPQSSIAGEMTSPVIAPLPRRKL